MQKYNENIFKSYTQLKYLIDMKFLGHMKLKLKKIKLYLC